MTSAQALTGAACWEAGRLDNKSVISQNDDFEENRSKKYGED
jgi:hypothetical protein